MRDSGAEPLQRERGRLVVAAFAGFVIGSGSLGVLWAASGSPSAAADDARAACSALRRAGTLPEAAETGHGGALAPGTIRRLTAAKELAAAAAELKPTAYRRLAEHIDGVARMVISLNFGDPGGRWHLAEARQTCAQV